MRIPSNKSWLIFLAGFATCVACIVVFLVALYYISVKPMEAKLLANLQAPEIFTPQPAAFDITAVGTNSTSLNFKDDRGRVIVLNFWATWCPPCMAELPSFGRLAAHYASSNDVAVVCLSQESADVVFKDSAALVSGAPIFSLNGGKVPDIFTNDVIPVTFVINPRGMVVLKHVGGADWSDPTVIHYIDSLRTNAVAAR